MLKKKIKARLRKSKKDLKKNVKFFFGWVKGAELIELKECDVSKDPVRPELDNIFRISYGRKILVNWLKTLIYQSLFYNFIFKILYFIIIFNSINFSSITYSKIII